MDVRRLGPEDLDACLALGDDRGWARETVKWSFLLANAEGFAIDADEGGLAGAVTLMRYGARAAWLGMMLVAKAYARRGLGLALVKHAIEAASGAPVMLYATDEGKPLYAKAGFVDCGAIVRHVGAWRAPPVAASSIDLDEACALDELAFGAPRGNMIRTMTALACRTARVPGRGYGLAWRNLDVVMVGPVVARDLDAAQTIVRALAAGHDVPVRVDAHEDQPSFRAWLRMMGLAPSAPAPMMVHGKVPGKRAMIYATSSQAKG